MRLVNDHIGAAKRERHRVSVCANTCRQNQPERFHVVRCGFLLCSLVLYVVSSTWAGSSDASPPRQEGSPSTEGANGQAAAVDDMPLDDPALDQLMDMDLEQLSEVDVFEVVTASRKPEKITETHSNITVITAKQIKEWGLRDLKDVLRRIAGYYVIADRDEWVFAARGLVSDNNQKYLILIDGHRMNSIENFGPGQIIELPNDLSNVKRIEIIRGPGSAVWGSAALAGVVNVITKDAKDLGATSKNVTAKFAESDTYTQNFQFGKVVNEDASWIVMGSIASQKGRLITQSAATTLPILDESSGFASHPFGTYTTALERREPGYMFQFKGNVGDFKLNAYAFHTSVFNRHFEWGYGRENYLMTDKYFAEATYDRQYFDDLDVTYKLGASMNRAEYFPYKQGDAAKLPFNIVWLDRSINASVNFRKPLERGFSLDGGVEYWYSVLGPNQRINSFDPNNPSNPTTGFWFDDYLQDHTLGGYLMLNYHPDEQWSFVLGSRLDSNTSRGDGIALTPRAGVVYRPVKDTAIKLHYHRGFLFPANFQIVGNAQVDSETIDLFELIWYQQCDNGSFTATAYWQKLSGFINILAGADYSGFANAGDYTSQGFELEYVEDVSPTFNVWGNMSYGKYRGGGFPADLPFNSRRIDPGGNLLSVAPFTFNLGCTVRSADQRWFVSPALRFVSEVEYRATPATTAALDTALYDKVGPFTYFDVNVGYEPNDNLGLYVSFFNLTDIRDQNHLSIWNGTLGQYGRQIQGSIALHW